MDALLAAIDAAVEANRRASQAPAPRKAPGPARHTQPVARKAPPEPPSVPAPSQQREELTDLHGWEPRGPTGALAGLFEDGNSLVRAVIAAEVLGPPAALRERPLWSPRPKEPST